MSNTFAFFVIQLYVVTWSGPYAVGEHAVALMCSLKLSTAHKNWSSLLDILIFVFGSQLCDWLQEKLFAVAGEPPFEKFCFLQVWDSKIDCFSSYFNKEMYRFLGDWWSRSQKRTYPNWLVQFFPALVQSFNSNFRRDWNAQESKYHKIIPKCSHGKLRITRHNDWHLGYESAQQAVSFEWVGGVDGVKMHGAVRKDLAWQESRHHWHRHGQKSPMRYLGCLVKMKRN